MGRNRRGVESSGRRTYNEKDRDAWRTAVVRKSPRGVTCVWKEGGGEKALITTRCFLNNNPGLNIWGGSRKEGRGKEGVISQSVAEVSGKE